MFSTSATLSAAKVSRAADWQVLETPTRPVLLESARQHNAILDAVFYDVGVVSLAEAQNIAPDLAPEGAILLVPPSGSGSVILCHSVDEFAIYGSHMGALAVAGVGSSALGTAAFARNVADAIGRPVAGVVSGYGLADLITEALGDSFWFGTLNSIRHAFEDLDRISEAGVIREPFPGTATKRESRDTRTVMALLTHPQFRFDLFVGHSKGNLVISEGLFELRTGDANQFKRIVEGCRIVTVSARVAMPRQFSGVIDVMGEWDWFGTLNSRSSINADHLVRDGCHHTNTELPAYLPVERTLRTVLSAA